MYMDNVLSILGDWLVGAEAASPHPSFLNCRLWPGGGEGQGVTRNLTIVKGFWMCDN